ncbi:MAG: endopeptidase La, partial [Nitrospinae bacterium]|nr:endopeptidase La [Nitrospinota bacterium]
SEVMFITTANVLHTIPRALVDRMEVIEIPGYNDEEKEQIARRFLLPRQLAANGLKPGDAQLPDAQLRRVIRNYTRESGVRALERSLGAICRKLARNVAEGMGSGKTRERRRTVVVDGHKLVELLGEIKFRDEAAEQRDAVGVATGLAWTETGGSILKIETIILEGKTSFILTGKLGDVMKESAQAALSYIRARARDFGLAPGFHSKLDIHTHIPEGAIPKDGPSAGITLATSIVSALLNIPVRADVAMTGEITLRGHALPVGGLNEKLLAAQRAGVKTVLIPRDNERDLSETPHSVRARLTITPVENMDEVLRLALVRSPWKRRGRAADRAAAVARGAGAALS